jgi:DNA-binding PadR family transcriptional regulator
MIKMPSFSLIKKTYGYEIGKRISKSLDGYS